MNLYIFESGQFDSDEIGVIARSLTDAEEMWRAQVRRYIPQRPLPDHPRLRVQVEIVPGIAIVPYGADSDYFGLQLSISELKAVEG